MKRKIVSLLFGTCFLLTPATIMSVPALLASPSDPVKEIELDGEFPDEKQLTLIKPIEAFIVGESIEVNIHDVLESVLITIYDEEGNIVYQQAENTDIGMSINMNVPLTEGKEYVIEFANSQGQCLYGKFER
ncbi:MAG: DUF3244 domain-containing protein [Tannerellaceae bacterium]|jgi:hypothetical protein|nr:DUF3244 domain-containing protein [Tannerellaceae bacterium]